ncbi:VirK/YbjX family protein [Paraburkholderia sp. CNPSo 3274]|nr:VirK/YbjX family protein [Paraburkholderia sp. CNPSo 3274]
MYALLHPFAAHLWLSALAANSLLADIVVQNRRYLERPFRRFVQTDMRAYARAELLCGHFRVVRERFGEELVRNLYLKSEDVTLALSGRYAIVVSEPVRCWREGLLTVAWRDVVDHVDLAWATISFEWCSESGKTGALIGGLQGPSGMDRERVREATRACHGLRPKAAVMEAVCVLCRMAGVGVLTGVTKKTHVSDSRPAQIRADYDGFWQELGGIERNGRYVLPLRLHHRDVSEVPSNRRAAFRRRQTLIADLLAQIPRAIDTDLIEEVMSPHLSHPKSGKHLLDLAVARATDRCDLEPGIALEQCDPTQDDRPVEQKLAA